MRVIKFRAWDKRQKSMYSNWQRGSLIAAVLSQKLATVPTRNDQFKPDGRDMQNFTFMQYTGLKDKNGKEIYEGDIVRIGDEQYSEVWPVEFMQGVYVLKLRNDTITLNTQTQTEVIGNIYENPELLK